MLDDVAELAVGELVIDDSVALVDVEGGSEEEEDGSVAVLVLRAVVDTISLK